MAKETITRCDGCDVHENVQFKQVPVTVGDDLNANFDLCPECSLRIIKTADPTTWERRPRKRTKAAKG